MPAAARVSLFCVLGMLTCGSTACNLVPRHELLQSQNRTKQLYEQNKALALDRQNLANENARMQQQMGDLAATRNTLQQRVDNLVNAQSQLNSRLASMRNQQSPLSSGTTRQFEDLARKYPDFEFDPQTGVSKFKSDMLFDLGSDDLKQTAALKEFARIINSGEAKELNILVVGHTDDTRIAKAATKAKFPTNMHLSAHRAISVESELAKLGVKESRIGIAGYGPHQPVAANSDAKSKAQNRRVEIFVLAPNASMAGWETGTTKK